MDSPLFYELPDHLDSLKSNSASLVRQNQRQPSRLNHLSPTQQQQLRSSPESGKTVAGLAPIRLPQNGAVFGNAPVVHLPNGEGSYAELADINTPEISLDLQSLIDCDGHLTDFSSRNQNQLQGSGGPSGSTTSPSYLLNFMRPSGGQSQLAQQYVPHQQQQQQQPQQQQLQQLQHYTGTVKEEPMDSGTYSPPPQYQNYGSYGVYASTSQPSALHATNSPGSVRSVSSSLSESSSSRRSGTAGSAGGSGKRLEKGGEEYRRRRERNNIAVRKSREKAKQKSRDTELKVKTLEQKNMELQETINNLEAEVTLLRHMMEGTPLPEQIVRYLQSLQLQQQRYQYNNNKNI